VTATLPTAVATRPTVPPTIGADPGQRWIGIVARIDHLCLDATTLDRGPYDPEDLYLGQDEPALAEELLTAIYAMMAKHHDRALEAARHWRAAWPEGMPWRIAVEGLVVTSKRRRQNMPAQPRLHMVKQLVEVAVPFSTITTEFRGAIVVPPRRFGNRNDPKHGDVLARLGPYPSELTGVRPVRFRQPKQAATRNHERSAWAVAGAAQLARPLLLAEGVRP
jgi:hypothetical protein